MNIQNILGGGRQCQCLDLPPLPPLKLTLTFFAKIYVEINQKNKTLTTFQVIENVVVQVAKSLLPKGGATSSQGQT